MKKFLWALLVVCAVMAWSPAVRAEQSPSERVKEGVARLIEMLSEPAMQDESQHAASIARLQGVAEEYIDFGLVTKYAVGKPWLDMSDDLRQQLKEAFMKLLERSYLKRIPAYGGQDVVYKRETITKNNAQVFTEIVDQDKKIVVEFRLKIVQDKWMIYDIVAEGVSLVMNYRSQFSEVLKQGNGEDLLRVIRQRIEEIGQTPQGEEESAS